MSPDLLSTIPFAADAVSGGTFAVVYGVVSRLVVVPAINALTGEFRELRAEIKAFMAGQAPQPEPVSRPTATVPFPSPGTAAS